MESRPIAGGVCKKFFFFFLHKTGPKWRDFSRVRPRSYGIRFKKSQILIQKVHLLGPPHPPKTEINIDLSPKINHGYGSLVEGKLQLAISTAAIFKEGGRWGGKLCNQPRVEQAFICLFICNPAVFFASCRKGSCIVGP